jgi:hypothetical protein
MIVPFSLQALQGRNIPARVTGPGNGATGNAVGCYRPCGWLLSTMRLVVIDNAIGIGNIAHASVFIHGQPVLIFRPIS